MASDNLPSEFDVVILGTGLTESIIASACSRVGQKVLHIDRRNYYSSKWAGFNFNSLLSWIEEHKAQQGAQSKDDCAEWRNKLVDGEEALLISADDSFIANLEVFCYASLEAEEEEKEEVAEAAPSFAEPEEGTKGEAEGSLDVTQETAATGETQHTPVDGVQEEGVSQDASQEDEAEEKKDQQEDSTASPVKEVKKKITYAHLVKEGRRFNIDLVSKMIYSRGSLVDLLIQSKVSRYTEFKIVTRILTYRNGRVEQVPCSRADVFASKQLTMVEKRMLMKFLTFCLDFEQHPEEYKEASDQLFWEFLQTKKLTENLQHFVLYSIAMVTKETRTEDGLKATQHFLRCLGRYGNTPFLFPLYGLGEIPQCFCRMSAVFGGIYCLRHSVQCLVVDKETNSCKAVIDTQGQRISCTHFVVEDGFVREQWKSTDERYISRAVLITDRSVLPADSEQQISLLTVPPLKQGGSAVHMVELCSSSMTCMPGTFLVHLTCSSKGTAQEDLEPLVSKMFYVPPSPGEELAEGDERSGQPTVLWALYFNMLDTSRMDGSSSNSGFDLPSNVHVCIGPDVTLGCDFSIKLAEKIFRQLLPDEEFCPPAPDPEDIIYEGEAPQGEGSGFEQETSKTEGSSLQSEGEGLESQSETEKEAGEMETPAQKAPEEVLKEDTSPSEE
ncbi:rab proteins geranylgeranyltransferase component A 1-like [Alosa sapidissima]|uniref:rab proteins geranylgeranyltransferase component A 1-like n=1 Tax=Alosa sapidissima TaxID=34773 RepID=UPI001C09BFAB|nr:rab proteins geranylgeranyltransferase component A 1-like [Alosa sapidissima]